MPLTFRPATPDDIPGVARLINSAYRGDSSRLGWTTEADLLDGQRTDSEALLEIIKRPDSYLLLAILDGQIVGCVHLEKNQKRCYLGMLTVAPQKQNTGLGRQLLQQAEASALQDGCQKIYMTVISVRKELISWYERRGYFNTMQSQPFPYGNPRFGLPKSKDLVFTVLEKDLLF